MNKSELMAALEAVNINSNLGDAVSLALSLVRDNDKISISDHGERSYVSRKQLIGTYRIRQTHLAKIVQVSVLTF
jgi:hypothetical protein